jgi:hypothetical protein
MALSPNTKPSSPLPFFWEELTTLAPEAVVSGSKAQFDQQRGVYILPVLNEKLVIDPSKKLISKQNAPHEEVGFMWSLLLLNYLTKAQDIPLTGKLVTEQEFSGGEFFFRGLHAFDFSRLEQRYAQDKPGLIQAGKALGGNLKPLGDAAVELWPLPRLPLTYILWLKDDEFPARFQVLFDSSAEHQLPADMIWNLVNLVNRRLQN